MITPGCDATFLEYRANPEAEKRVRRKMRLEGPLILYAAATRAYKNVERLLQAFQVLRERHSVRHTLVVTGLPGRSQGSLLERVRVLGLEREVFFTGYVEEEDLPALYSTADVYVHPSEYEGFGLPPLEAMACGTPVAASACTSLPEVVGDAGLLFDPSDPEDMAETLWRLLADDGLRAEMVRRGRARAQTFTWEKSARAMLSLILEAAGGRVS
jgi:glycosyltransferase involved in cell wall biosynthesis